MAFEIISSMHDEDKKIMDAARSYRCLRISLYYASVIPEHMYDNTGRALRDYMKSKREKIPKHLGDQFSTTKDGKIIFKQPQGHLKIGLALKEMSINSTPSCRDKLMAIAMNIQASTFRNVMSATVENLVKLFTMAIDRDKPITLAEARKIAPGPTKSKSKTGVKRERDDDTMVHPSILSVHSSTTGAATTTTASIPLEKEKADSLSFYRSVNHHDSFQDSTSAGGDTRQPNKRQQIHM